MASGSHPILSPPLAVYEANIFYPLHDNSWKKMVGNDIDVYLEPLISELKELWFDGVQTFDYSKKRNVYIASGFVVDS